MIGERHPQALGTPTAHFCYVLLHHMHARMFSMAPGVISQQDGVQVVTHMEVHVREAVTRSQGDIALAKTPPLVSDSPACVTDVLLSSNERMFVLALDHPAKHWHCVKKLKWCASQPPCPLLPRPLCHLY